MTTPSVGTNRKLELTEAWRGEGWSVESCTLLSGKLLETFAALRVSRQCPLVLLVKVDFEARYSVRR
jgi:hypothetical protein